MALGKETSNSNCGCPFQTLSPSMYYIVYIKLDDTVDELSEPDLNFVYFSSKMYSLEILEKIEAIRTTLFPHPDLYRGHLKEFWSSHIELGADGFWPGVAMKWTWSNKATLQQGCRPDQCPSAALWVSFLILSSFPFSFPFPLSHFSLISSSERPLTIVSLCFCVFWGWSFHFMTPGHTPMGIWCRMIIVVAVVTDDPGYVWLDAKTFRTVVYRDWESTGLNIGTALCALHESWCPMPGIIWNWITRTLGSAVWDRCMAAWSREDTGPAQPHSDVLMLSHPRLPLQTFWEGHPTSIVAVIVAGHGGKGANDLSLESMAVSWKLKLKLKDILLICFYLLILGI